jgi:hypothetical protein
MSLLHINLRHINEIFGGIMNYFSDMSKKESIFFVKEIIHNFINVQENQDNKGTSSFKSNLKRAMSIRNVINTLHLTPFKVLKSFWSDISLYSHKYRNINQTNREPDTLEKMKMLEDIGLFKLLGKTGPTKGHTGAHNISKNEKGLFGRWNNFLTLDGHGENLDYRGISGSCFEGIQCIYNENTGKLVTEDLNKGTFDYCHPSKDNFKHFIYDVLPWVVWSNCGDDSLKSQVIPKSSWKQIENIWNSYSKNETEKAEAQVQISKIIEENHPIKNKVKLTFNKNDKPNFDQIEIEETQSAESYFVISLINDISLKIPTNSCKEINLQQFFQ